MNTTTATPAKISTIDINALEWFDKVNGNSYFAGTITVNYGTPEAQTFKMPYQYGYGDQYIHEALQVLFENNLIEDQTSMYDIINLGIIVRKSKRTGCKKSELKNI
jgi:hypothetical protein